MKTFSSPGIILWALLCVCGTIASAQGKIAPAAVKGVVLDRSTRQAIPNANVILVGTVLGAATDVDGRFLLEGIPPGTYHLQASALGYIGDSKSEVGLLPGRTASLEFLLEATTIKGEEVVVRGGGYFQPKPDLITSSRSLRFEEVRRAPGSAEDVQRVIQALPGVANSNDQNNEIIVRGGSPAENLLLLDGIEIDNINHFPYHGTSGGPIGLVNPEFLQEITFASGGFSARYGDRLSSVLDLNLREGEGDLFSGQLELSIAGVGANIEGGVAGGTASYLASYRKSYLDLIHGPIGLTSVPHYWDAQFKLVYDPSARDKLSINGLYGRDRISIEAEEESAYSRGAEAVDAGGYTLALGGRWRRIWKGGYTDIVLATTELRFEYDVREVNRDPLNGALVKRPSYWERSTETGNQLHILWTGKARHSDEFSAGLTLKPITFSHNTWLEQDTTLYEDFSGDGVPDSLIHPPRRIDTRSTSLKYGAFLQYRYRPRNNLTLIAGLRWDGFQYSGESSIAPRLSCSWEFIPRLTLNSAYGIYYQSHPLMYYDWDPGGGNRSLPHMRADQYINGVSWMVRDASLISVEGYYKDYRSIAVEEESLWDEDEVRPRSWKYLAVGRKWAWGLELFAQQKLADNWYGTLSYSYAESVSDNSQETYPSDFDYRHITTLVLGYSFSGLPVRRFQREWYGLWVNLLPISGDECTASTRFRYVSGRPYTDRLWTDAGPRLNHHWEDASALNTARYPAYSRCDVRWDSKWYYGRRAIVLFMEVQNVLDRGNIAEYIYADDGEIDEAYQFRFFFVGGVRVEF